MAPLEVIMATAITLPPLVWFCWVGVRLCRQLYCVISTMIGSPYI